jgi:predicted nucleotidyltransferase component of viral defense system
MTKGRIKNTAASVRQRLLVKARETARPFNELLQYYAMERFLYRMSQSQHSQKFILKGALMLTAWRVQLSRPTMDIDLLGRLSNGIDSLVEVVKEVCTHDTEPDGIRFDPDSVVAERIVEDAKYEGVRVRFRGYLDTARVSMQLDIGFGDEVIPSSLVVVFPTILQMPAPKIHGYTRESTVAEKFEAMVKLGILNSRMKDFYDIWILSRQFDFDRGTLESAIRAAFLNRGTEMTVHPVALSGPFAEDTTKRTQWKAFIRKSRLENAPEELAEVTTAIAVFLEPLIETMVAGGAVSRIWKAPGPWQRS